MKNIIIVVLVFCLGMMLILTREKENNKPKPFKVTAYPYFEGDDELEQQSREKGFCVKCKANKHKPNNGCRICWSLYDTTGLEPNIEEMMVK